ncbi:alpha/beta hydrolase [Pandoraea pnomenusa]|uniref:alpha/beta fold hydrolase n=1 Tax=Pandoraea pnomenusa TaxID=93220 RepID=UPI0033403846
MVEHTAVSKQSSVSWALGRVESSDGCPIAYGTTGNANGIPVVFLHGFGLDHRIWETALSGDLLREFRVLAIDLRGHGASGRPATSAAYADGRLWADDLGAVVAREGVSRFAAVAWSFGGRMLLDYVEHKGADRIFAANLICAASLSDPTLLGSDHGVLAELCSVSGPVAQQAAERFLRDVLRLRSGDAAYHAAHDALSSVSAEQRQWLRQRPLQYDALIDDLRIPVLVSHGMCDSVVLPDHALRLRKRLRNVSVSRYDGEGHAPFLGDPARFARELSAFIRRHKDSARATDLTPSSAVSDG